MSGSKTINSRSVSGCALALTLLTSAASAGAGDASARGEVLLDNARVLVQKFVIQPGQDTGRRTLAGDQLLVFVKGGVLTSRTGRSTLWKDGRVVWKGAPDGADSTNTGATPIEMVWVTLKPLAASSAAVGPAPQEQRQPTIGRSSSIAI